MEPVDDQLLSAFIAGAVTPEQRAHVLRHIARDADAREIVGMARQAMGTVDAEARLALAPRRARRAPWLVRVTLGAVLVLASGAGLRIALQAPASATDTLRADTAETALTVRTEGDGFRWTVVPGAARYEIVVWDAATAAVTARTVSQTTETGQAFADVLRSARASETPQQVRVDAFDAENRLLASSPLTEVPR